MINPAIKILYYTKFNSKVFEDVGVFDYFDEIIKFADKRFLKLYFKEEPSEDQLLEFITDEIVKNIMSKKSIKQ